MGHPVQNLHCVHTDTVEHGLSNQAKFQPITCIRFVGLINQKAPVDPRRYSPNFQYGERGSMPPFLRWIPDIESDVLETPNIVTDFWSPYAERNLLNGSI